MRWLTEIASRRHAGLRDRFARSAFKLRYGHLPIRTAFLILLRAKPMLDYFLAFQESFNRFPGFNYEVQGVFQERVDGRIKFHTYVVRE